MEFDYELKPNDFPIVYRVSRPLRLRGSLITTVFFAVTLAPVVTLLWILQRGEYAAPILVAVAVLFVWRAIAVRLRSKGIFQHYCFRRVLRLTPDYLETESASTWHRCEWWWFREVRKLRGWLVLYRTGFPAAAVVLPSRLVAAAAEQGVDLEQLIKERIASAQQRGDGIAAVDRLHECVSAEPSAAGIIDFALSRPELSIVASRGFQVRGAPSRSPWLFVLVMFSFVLLLMWMEPDEELTRLVRDVFAPALLLVAGLAAGLPLQQWAYGRLVGDQMLLSPTRVRYGEGGIEIQQAGMQALMRWPMIKMCIDAQRFVVVLNKQGGILAIPRCFAPAEDDALRDLVNRSIASIIAEPPANPGAAVETGNPYQSPPAE